MPLLTSLLLLIITARLLGQLFERYQQPGIVGEMLAGVVLGPAVFNLIHASEALNGISALAVFLVVLSAGLEMTFRDVINVLRGKGLVVASLGFVIPFALGMAVGFAFGMDLMRTIFLGLCISITALPVAVRILESFKILDTDIARYSVATAILNDIVALLILGVILSLPEQKSFWAVAKSVGVTGGKLVLLASLILGVNWALEVLERRGVKIHWVPEKLVKIFGSEALFGILVLFVLVFGAVSEMLGFHFVVGAFFGALLISKEHFLASRYAELERTLHSVTSGFLAPVFFATLGLEFDMRQMGSPWLVLVVLVVSIGSKIFAGWWGGKLCGMPHERALGVGIILNGRGVMELVIASIAFEYHFIGQGLFSILVLMGVVTTMITPMLFRRFVQPALSP